MHPQDTGTDWGLFNKKNCTYLTCRLCDKAIDSAKSQLSFRVLMLHLAHSEPMQHKWTRNRCPPLPETWLHLHRTAVCWPGVSSSFTPKNRAPRNTLCLSFITTTTALFMSWPSCPFSPLLLPQVACVLPIHTMSTNTCPARLLWLTNDFSHHIPICRFVPHKGKKKRLRCCKEDFFLFKGKTVN